MQRWSEWSNSSRKLKTLFLPNPHCIKTYPLPIFNYCNRNVGRIIHLFAKSNSDFDFCVISLVLCPSMLASFKSSFFISLKTPVLVLNMKILKTELMVKRRHSLVSLTLPGLWPQEQQRGEPQQEESHGRQQQREAHRSRSWCSHRYNLGVGVHRVL